MRCRIGHKCQKSAARSVSRCVKSGYNVAPISSRWRVITLTELCSKTLPISAVVSVMKTRALGCRRISTGSVPMWSWCECEMRMASSCRSEIALKFGSASSPMFFGCIPQSRTRRWPLASI